MKLKSKFNEVVDFFDSPLGSQIKYYALFCFVLWSVHLILISLISYFHLLLNHNIRTIGDWIGDRGWALIIISKVLIFYLALQFIRLKSKKISLVRSYFRNSIQLPRKEVIVALLFLIIGLMGLGRITLNHTLIFELDRMILSMVGTFIFFSVDYALLIVLEIFFPLESAIDKKRKLFIFPLLFYYFTYATFIYEQTVSFRLYAFFFLLLYLGEWRRRNWTLPMLFLLAFLIPCYALFGLDPVWSSSYTFFTVTNVISSFSIFVLIGFAIAYLQRTQKNNPEYIYRD
ncbi:MAG: hypothetical protein H7281_09910 [Bacteriovorax sp.]|nr:hypothetical protein [Bacteriovorax sp.]